MTITGPRIPCQFITVIFAWRFWTRHIIRIGVSQSSCCAGWAEIFTNRHFLPSINIKLSTFTSQGEVKRVIQHFHFTTWPDFGVPSPPQTLARFVRAFRERVRPDQRPIVVHCSAGVGRSGTFITLDRILQQILVSDYVDIFGIVCAMRKERVWMVQTEQQYICIHQCLLAVLEGQDTTGPIREIHDNQGFEGEK